MKNSYRQLFLSPIYLLLLAACSEMKGGFTQDTVDPNAVEIPQTVFTISSSKQLIGGPLATGRMGDVLLENDKIRVIIQQPGKAPGLGSFGGSIIDADLKRSGAGEDNFGDLFPLINMEWTLNYTNYEVLADGSDGEAKVLRAYGVIDAYDYLDIDFVADVAEPLLGQRLNFSNRFDDRRDPFHVYEDLRELDHQVVTDYILEPGKNYVTIKTTFQNPGSEEVRMPVGEFVNGSGALSLLIPGAGFTPGPKEQIAAHTPGVIYVGYADTPVSYGYFYDPREFVDSEGKMQTTSSITQSGLTGMLLGEGFLQVIPLSQTDPQIHFSIPAQSSRTITSYFVIGDGSAGPVFDGVLQALNINTRAVSGVVKDASGAPVEKALVAVQNKGGATIVTYWTDAQGKFSGLLPIGDNQFAKSFGKGIYSVLVDVPGYHQNQTNAAGSCTPDTLDTSKGSMKVECVLGETGTVRIAAPVIDEKGPTAVRLSVVGLDPSPNVRGGAGMFYDNDTLAKPFGISDAHYITAKGTIDFTDKNTFNLEPGAYRLVISHGPEYSIDERFVEVEAGKEVVIDQVKLRHIVSTKGYISSDLHIHAISSPDSPVANKYRVLGAVAEGLDILQSSDHDYLTDYHDLAEELMNEGLIPQGSLKTSVGVEITPNQYGHIQAFPLDAHPDQPNGGVIDWTASPHDEVNPSSDYCMSPAEIMDAVNKDPGIEVLQMNHISDVQGGLPVASGWVTTVFYQEQGVDPLTSYVDPVERRIFPDGVASEFPRPYGSSALVNTNFGSAELMIGQHLNDMNQLFRSALPTWFNFLNLGALMTATANSDSHTIIHDPIGMPRNFIQVSVDPRDGLGSDHREISLEDYAIGVNEGKVVVSAGPYMQVFAHTADGAKYGLRDVVPSRELTLEVTVEAPDWAWFDTVEVYINTEPIPVDDVTGEPMSGVAADAATFDKPYRMPQYTYQPSKSFRLIDGTLSASGGKEWKQEDGKITAHLELPLRLEEDAWIVVMARGTQVTPGYRSLFPMVANVVKDGADEPENFDPADLSAFHADKNVSAPAWALANPILVDVDGDGYKAKYVRDGRSPLAK